LIGVFFRKFHHHPPRRSDDLPCQEDVLQPECLDLLPVFISYRGNLRRLDKNLTPKTLHSILKNRVARAGPPLTIWHDFRRTILSDVIARSGFTTAQHLAGSSSSATTARYDRLSRENVQEAINYRSDAPSPTGAPL